MYRFVSVCFLLLVASLLAAQNNDDGSRVYKLDSAVVVGHQPLLGKGSNYVYTPAKAGAVVSAVGEPDVVRQVLTLPGVSAGIEGSLGLFIRGGNAGGNRLELDGVPIYNATHLFGLFSAIPSEIVSSAQVKTGGFEARYGNYTSGIIRSMLKTDPVEKTRYSVSASPFVEGFFAEFPGKGNVKAGLRYSPAPQLMPLVGKEYGLGGVRGIIFDAIGSASYDLDNGDRLSGTLFASVDQINSMDKMPDSGWYSFMAKAQWQRRLSSGESLDVLAYCSGGGSRQTQRYYSSDGEQLSSFSLDNNILEWAAAGTLTKDFSTKLNVAAGVELRHLIRGVDLSLYADARYQPTKRISASAGYRQTFHMDGKFFRTNFDAHALVGVELTRFLGVEFSYDRSTQYYHLLEGLPTGWALNMSVPINSLFPEEVSNQLYSGLFSSFRLFGMSGRANAGAYYKRMHNLVSYLSSTNVFHNTNQGWVASVSRGMGWSYGIETSAALTSDRFALNAAYTYSRTTRRYPGINKGEEFPFKFDRPHILNVEMDLTTFEWKTRKGRKNAQHAIFDMQYSSGNLATMYIRRYKSVMPPYWTDESVPEDVMDALLGRTQLSEFNGYRMPAYFRIDVGYTFEFETARTAQSLSLTVFNVLNRHNPYLIFNDRGIWKQLSIMPIMPSVRWRIEF